MVSRPWTRGTAAQAAASSRVLPAGDLGVETDTGNLKVGDGTSLWGALKRLVRVDEVTTAVQQYVTSVIVTNANLTALAAESGYQWALIDSTGKVAWGVTPDGTTVAAKLSLAAGSVPQTALSAAAQVNLMQTLPAETGYAWVLVGTAGKAAILVDQAGAVSIPKLALPDGSVTLAKLSTAVQGSIPTTIPPESGYVSVELDAAGRIARGVRQDGTVVGKGIGSGARVVANDTWIIQSAPDTSGRLQIKATRRSTGQVTALTSSGSNTNPALTTDHQVLFLADGAPMWVPAAGGTVYPAFSLASLLYVPGDSLTAGTGASSGKSYPQQLADRLGAPQVINDGAGGQTSRQIVARQGGLPALVTVPGNSLGATTSAITVTVDVDLLTSAAGQFSRTGTIAGVHGTLAGGTTLSTYTFTRDTAGSAVATSGGGEQFVPDTLGSYATGILGIWTGRNNFKTDSPATIVSHITAMIAAQRAYQRRFYVLTIPPAVGEETGTGVRAQLDAANAALLAAWPDNSIDVATLLRTSGLALAGITPTTQDTTDIANGLTPTSLRGDTLHLNDAGYLVVATLVQQHLNGKGWL